MRALLEERLARDPQDAEARAELERLNQGLPLRATETALTRKRREEQEMQEELAAELELFRSTPSMVNDWERSLLAKRRKRIALIRSAIGKRLSSEQNTLSAAYLKAITDRLARHKVTRRRRLFLTLGLPLFAASAAAAAALSHHRAEQAEAELRQAMSARDLSRVEYALSVADSSIHQLANRELPELIRQAETWLARTKRRQASLLEELAALETGETSIRSLSLVRRAEIERWLDALPSGANELRERWQRLCEREARALAQQREEVMQRFNAPLPPLPHLSNSPVEDDALLKQQEDSLQQLSGEWEAARNLFSFEGEYGERLQTQLAEIRQLRKDIAALRHTATLLPTARSYAQYRKLLEKHQPMQYAPALHLTAIRDRLPHEDGLRDRMQDHGRELPPGMLEAARHALLKGGPSFTPAFPANARQTHLMEDVFTAKVLQQPLFELSAPTLPSVIVETAPEVSDGCISFSPSPLTPGYSLDMPRRMTWHNAQGVFIRRIDATSLLRDTGIRRENFFSDTNLPTLLDTLLRFEHAECPELARAYLFKRVLEVMAAHEWPTMLGLAYAPTLRKDARSFAKLIRELGFPLEAGCWLKSSPETARAEEVCAAWFHEHRHRHYAQEIARNFSSLVQVSPRYIGFIDNQAKPQLYRKLPEGTLLWYITEKGLTTTPWGDPLEAPLIYSPVFIVTKD